MSDLATFENRSRAESFGSVAEIYERARPSYPPALVDALVFDGATRVLDVGCGTGKAGTLFAQRGCAVLGVEVDARMASVATAKGLEVVISRFELWDPGTQCFDLVISAQAWHWVDPSAGAGKAASVLRDGGRIGLFWNLGNPPEEIRERLAPIYASLAPGLESRSVVLGNRGRRAAETLAGLEASGAFEAGEVQRFRWQETYSTRAWLDFLLTHSDHQTLEPRTRKRLLGAVAEAIGGLGASFEVAYETVLVTARRRAREGLPSGSAGFARLLGRAPAVSLRSRGCRLSRSPETIARAGRQGRCPRRPSGRAADRRCSWHRCPSRAAHRARRGRSSGPRTC